MTDRRQLKTPGRAGHLARFLREDCGAARHDRFLLIAGGVVVGALVVFMSARDALEGGGETVAEAPAATAPGTPRTVSSAPVWAPEPPPPAGGDGSGGRVFVSSDYSEAMAHRPDREEQLLEEELARLREAETAAAAEGGDPGVATGADAAATAAAAGTPGGS